MSQRPAPSRRVLSLNGNSGEAEQVLKALASEPRQRILELLSDRVCNLSEIAEALVMPLSTVTLHVGVLEEAGLIRSELQPAARGRQKLCARTYDVILLQLARGDTRTEQVLTFEMPVGAYVDCQVTPTCGLASAEGIIGLFDDAASFYDPERLAAQLVWFHQGYVEYRFPNRLPATASPISLELSLELGSEAPLHHPEWPSDITIWINGVEIGTWTSPADFGDRRGALTPAWWESWNSQYGLLKVWQVTGDGAYLEGLRLSDRSLADLKLMAQPFITVRIGIKPDARHIGGVNIFGHAFGNYPQDIILRLAYA